MFFSQTVEYALRAAVWLAGHEGPATPTAVIAEGTQVPPSYLAKVLQQLSRAGLVQGTRGAHGGFVLARPAREISVFDIVEAVDPLERIVSCPLALETHGDHLCPLHRKLDEAMAAVEQCFRDTSLFDLTPKTDPAARLCSANDLVRK